MFTLSPTLRRPMLAAMFAAATVMTVMAVTATPTQAQAPSPLPQVDGEIRKVDGDAGKLTIRHGDIPNLGMPGMTMVFKAAPDLLARARPGEKIRFTADRVDGALTITTLEEKP